MRTVKEFIDNLLIKVPELQPLYNEHMLDYDSMLPHVFMGDLTRFVVTLHKDILVEGWRRRKKKMLALILEELEQALVLGNHDLQELICVSFIENLDPLDKDYKALELLFGKELLKQVR
jgi:hypothetical protein